MMDEEDGVTNRRVKKTHKKRAESRLLLEGESTEDLDM